MEHKLLEAINTASMFVDAKRKYYPILGSVCVNGCVKSTDLETFYSAGLDCSELENGGYSLQQVKAIYNSAAKCKPMFNLEEFPNFPELKNNTPVINIDAKVFAERLNRLAVFASSDPTRYNIVTICIGKDSIVSTNGHCLLEIETPAYKELIPGNVKNILLPIDAAKKIVKWIKARRIEKVQLACDGVLLHLYRADSGVIESIWCRLVDGQFPDTKQITEVQDYSGNVYCSVSELRECLKKVCSVLPLVSLTGRKSEKGKQIMLSQEKVAGTESYRLVMSGSDKENGIKVSQSVACSLLGNFKAGEIVSINGLYLLDYLNGIPKGVNESVTLRYKDVLSMIRIERASNCIGECLIIMPIRTK